MILEYNQPLNARYPRIHPIIQKFTQSYILARVPKPIPPTLVDAGAIKRRVPEQRVGLVVRLTEPSTEYRTVTLLMHVRWAELQGLPKVLFAVSERLQRRRLVQQPQNVRALCGARPFG